jgi:CBS domain-containing protein
MQARDIMTADVVTVAPQTPVGEIARLLAEKQISGAPVVDDAGRLRGIVTEADLILRAARPHFPRYIPFLEGVIFLENPRHYEEQVEKILATTAEQIMTAKVITVAPDARVEEVATLMAERNINRVVVVEGERVVGIVTRADVIRTLGA